MTITHSKTCKHEECIKQHSKRSAYCSKKCKNKHWYLNNRDKVIKKENKRRIEQIKEYKKYQQQYYQVNKNKCIERSREYRRNNRDKINIYMRKYNKKRRQENINFKIKCSIRSRLYDAIKNNQKIGSAVENLGCTIDKLKQHLELQFENNMNWDNYGEWHIDHIKPLSKFDLTNIDEFKEVCHYSNLQPLWAEDNLKKSNK